MWNIWKTQVAETLHHRDPHGPQLGGPSRNQPAASTHPHIYSSLPQSCLVTTHRPLPTKHPKDPKGGQLTGYALGQTSQIPEPAIGTARTSHSPRRPRHHKPVLARSARRYGFNTMNYRRVVSQPIHHSAVCGTTGNNPPVQSPVEHPRADTGIICQRASVESPVLLADLRQQVLHRGGLS